MLTPPEWPPEVCSPPFKALSALLPLPEALLPTKAPPEALSPPETMPEEGYTLENRRAFARYTVDTGASVIMFGSLYQPGDSSCVTDSQMFDYDLRNAENLRLWAST